MSALHSTFIYLSLHAIAYVLLFMGVMGTPGNPDESNKKIALLLKLWGVLVLIAWKGIPILLAGALVAFYFQYTVLGKILSLINLALGLSLCLVVVLYYSIQNKSKL